MKLAVSNIAWPREQDEAVAELLNEHGVAGIEVAPTKLFAKPLDANDSDIAAVRRFWAERGLAIVAAQSLLFGKPELAIFESAGTRAATLEYLGGIVRLCAKLGAGAMVFGSPKNRRAGSLPTDEAMRIAVEFFTRLGESAASAGTCIVMEANPPVYGADFVTRAADAIELVERVNHPGFRLHLDTGCMTLAGDSIADTFARGSKWMKHFHVSEPNLDPPGTSGKVDHATFASELRNYTGWISLEMREGQPFDFAVFTQSVRWLRSNYRQSGI
ncbi:MAG: sugar phosphate isomerase/epimerase family protein [Gemmataceae bacterium]